jgi:hypothetical protein
MNTKRLNQLRNQLLKQIKVYNKINKIKYN